MADNYEISIDKLINFNFNSYLDDLNEEDKLFLEKSKELFKNILESFMLGPRFTIFIDDIFISDNKTIIRFNYEGKELLLKSKLKKFIQMYIFSKNNQITNFNNDFIIIPLNSYYVGSISDIVSICLFIIKILYYENNINILDICYYRTGKVVMLRTADEKYIYYKFYSSTLFIKSVVFKSCNSI